MGTTLRPRHVVAFIPLVVAIVIFGAWSAVADHVEPEFKTGNPTCSEFGSGWNELKIEPVADGTYSDDDETPGPLTVTITVDEDAQEFDWTSNIGVDAVFVKGGDNGNLYRYDPESTGDTGLHAPLNDNNDTWFGLSHISFCYDTDGSPSPSPSVSPSDTVTPTPTPTETPSESPSPTPSDTETPGVTVSPTTIATSPSVLGTKVLGNTGADVRNLIVLALALIALGVIAYAAARRSSKSS